MSKLQICDKFSCEIEPYWKFSDMVVSVVETDCNIFPKDERLELIANKWQKCSKFILTSDTITDNAIKISDIAMVDIWITT